MLGPAAWGNQIEFIIHDPTFLSKKNKNSFYLFTSRSLLQIQINAINTIVIPPSCNLAGLNG